MEEQGGISRFDVRVVKQRNSLLAHREIASRDTTGSLNCFAEGDLALCS